MPRPVFPVVRLPYDQPDRVARVLDAVRREFKASATAAIVSRRPQRPLTSRAVDRNDDDRAMTAVQQHAREPEPTDETTTMVIDRAATATGISLDQVTVGVRDCTLTPKVRPEILVSGGGGTPVRNAYLHPQQHHHHRQLPPSATGDDGGPYLLVPPVNITAEISRPPLTPQYSA